MENKYTKLSDLVNGTFTVTKVYGYKWKMWDNATKKMLVSDTWAKDHRKIYGVETDKGILDLSASQLGILLETISKNGEANLIGRTFQVKSNGKTGMDIRYFFNAVQDVPDNTPEQDEINLDDVIF
jgi:hypothetical protein